MANFNSNLADDISKLTQLYIKISTKLAMGSNIYNKHDIATNIADFMLGYHPSHTDPADSKCIYGCPDYYIHNLYIKTVSDAKVKHLGDSMYKFTNTLVGFDEVVRERAAIQTSAVSRRFIRIPVSTDRTGMKSLDGITAFEFDISLDTEVDDAEFWCSETPNEKPITILRTLDGSKLPDGLYAKIGRTDDYRRDPNEPLIASIWLIIGGFKPNASDNKTEISLNLDFNYLSENFILRWDSDIHVNVWFGNGFIRINLFDRVTNIVHSFARPYTDGAGAGHSLPHPYVAYKDGVAVSADDEYDEDGNTSGEANQ